MMYVVSNFGADAMAMFCPAGVTATFCPAVMFTAPVSLFKEVTPVAATCMF
jgi:hypothetical protein